MKLLSKDFFTQAEQSLAVEPRAPQPVFPEHTHDFDEIFIVTGGQGHHVINGHPSTLYPGMVCYIQADDYHLFENIQGLTLTNILYRSARSFRYLSDIDILLPNRQKEPLSHWFLNRNSFEEVEGILSKWDNLPEQAGVYEESLFLQLLVALQKGRYNEEGEGDNEQRVIQTLRWLQQNYRENVDWDALSEQFGLSPRTFHRYMKNQLNCTPQNYLIKLRLSQAYYQLRFTDKAIIDIAFDCGFNDSAYFSTRFKNEFSITPREIRHCISQKSEERSASLA